MIVLIQRFNDVKKHGLGFFGFLTLLFIGLKLTDYIDWSWVWVLSPLWILPMVFLIFALVALFFVWRMKRKMMKQFQGFGDFGNMEDFDFSDMENNPDMKKMFEQLGNMNGIDDKEDDIIDAEVVNKK